jgi:tRNA (guanine-N7-)-methyltransferase
MSLRVRHHVNPLSAGFLRFRGALPELPADREVELEIGCADAQFLFERAARRPDRAYLGLEIRRDLVTQVNQRARCASLPVRAVFANASLHLRRVCGDQSIDRVYVNFPDPWFKRRHRKRRLIDDALVEDLLRVLRPRGEVFVQTDVWEVALDALAVFEARERELENLAGTWSFWKADNPYDACSLRERYCREDGVRIWRLRYRLR